MSPGHLVRFDQHPLYALLLLFFGLYPVVSSLVWIATAVLFYLRRERGQGEAFYDLGDAPPPVSVLIPAFSEEAVIRRTLTGVCALRYPDFEVVVIDDASTDGTAQLVEEFRLRAESGPASLPPVRLIQKRTNEGKAMALNDAIPCLRGDLVLVIDADAYPDPDLLRYLVPHFRSARVGAVTGNPKVANRETFLAQLQLIEFTSIVSLLRRAQRIWGRILTMSGVVGLFRKSALFDVGLYAPEMATEDIDISWKLQRARYDVRYESRALVWMQVPPTLGRLWKQRMRWARGLSQILRRHRTVWGDPRDRRLWPVVIEATLSVMWAYCAVLLTVFWIASSAVGHLPRGISPIPLWWGMLIATLCIAQLATGVLLERRYDREVVRYFPVAVFYPIVYWMLMALVTVLATPFGLLVPSRRGAVTRWQTERDPIT
ncbi:MAG: glycosyltransferase [Candidatus Eisenbacteria bacterium]|uniref:Poly-beta-1,6 N-acetyl-D-glucosamine synthase n=1 Tax=Eiseniibacteriota bacterium TaxID=2212470 RepID=A0A956M361_UNCEI|nr:poly-beta-1,6 N-acetyl-D-glucosamine synthase [Candidatus Eisenbacteria bacterium]